MDAPSGRAEPRQRWRIVFRRTADAPAVPQRELVEALEAGLAASGLPLVEGGRRPRLAFGAPLLVGMAAERELADLLLAERRPIHEVRRALTGALPGGIELVDLYDVWLGEPALVAQVVAADYRLSVVLDPPASVAGLEEACRALLRARELPRERHKGAGTVRYDLRPLLADVSVAETGPPVVLRCRTRFLQDQGAGRPAEVALAVGDAVGARVEIVMIVRERLVLAGEE